MKKQLLLLIASLPFFLQAQNSYFEDGTLDSWTNSDGSTIGLTNETHSQQSNPGIISLGQTKYLQKTCDGTNTASGIMSIKSLDFSGDFLIVTGNAGTVGVDRCEFIIRNTNSFDLNLRIVLTGIHNTKIVSTDPIVIPANSDWMYSHLPMYSETIFTLVPGSTPNVSINDVLSTVVSTEIIHNTSIATEGESMTGLLEIDAIGMLQLLSVKEDFLSTIKVFPNPVVDQLFINFPAKTKGKLTLMSIDGRKLLTQDINTEQMQLDVSTIKSKGIYFLKIETSQGTLTKKVVKA